MHRLADLAFRQAPTQGKVALRVVYDGITWLSVEVSWWDCKRVVGRVIVVIQWVRLDCGWDMHYWLLELEFINLGLTCDWVWRWIWFQMGMVCVHYKCIGIRAICITLKCRIFRRYLEIQRFLERVAPGGESLMLSGLQPNFAWRRLGRGQRVVPMDWCVFYNALHDTLRMKLTKAFLELWLKMEGKHAVISSCVLVILENQFEYASCGPYGWVPLD